MLLCPCLDALVSILRCPALFTCLSIFLITTKNVTPFTLFPHALHINTNIHTGNSNSGWCDGSTELGEVMQTLSNFSYHMSDGQFVLCDLQGARDFSGGAIITDPAISSIDMSYGSAEMGLYGILFFFQEHVCNILCDENWVLPANMTPFLHPVGGTTRWDGTMDRYVDEQGSHSYVPQFSETAQTAGAIGEEGLIDRATTVGELLNEEMEELDVEEFNEELEENDELEGERKKRRRRKKRKRKRLMMKNKSMRRLNGWNWWTTFNNIGYWTRSTK